MSIISTDISKALTILNDDELVAIPTETVYGLAGNIYSKKAVNAIFSTKKRPFFNPLIVHIQSPEYLATIVSNIPKKAQQLANAFWPGPLTLVLQKKETIPDLITAGKDTVAVRVPNHPITLSLLKQLPFPLAAPSANPFNRISPTTAQHVEDYFKDDIKMVLDKMNQGITAKSISDAIISIRHSKLPDPSKIGNAGSFFKNPIIPKSQFERLQKEFSDIPSYPVSANQVKVPAGWLIEKAGLKGKSFGNYGIHEKQALVLVNYGNATGEELLNLSRLVQQTIFRLFNIKIEAEVNII